ncbi:hypothetical protein KL86DES1_21417 [uncultured Desulfovibrio sp.]|uniref:Uncharacterized protein n=1 Tax=uncultured Desulfovibrio sp. TaxID=167968 RepID=A0A212L817_9BACT|nr:hypothetical protein KL86DES1_21417 [uncultured Desulfovibrio sp.]VZH34314.1 conserved protein of unknown function [Desulfovibrio sp. 86]
MPQRRWQARACPPAVRPLYASSVLHTLDCELFASELTNCHFCRKISTLPPRRWSAVFLRDIAFRSSPRFT